MDGYFNPGEIVTIRQELQFKPIMYVYRVDKLVLGPSMEKTKGNLIGIRCRWFSADLVLQEASFSTKDLVHV